MLAQAHLVGVVGVDQKRGLRAKGCHKAPVFNLRDSQPQQCTRWKAQEKPMGKTDMTGKPSARPPDDAGLEVPLLSGSSL